MKYTSFNDSELTQHYKGDEEILIDAINMFQGNLDSLLRPLRDSVLSEDAVQLELNAHTFKGIMGNFYAEEGKSLAFELELRGQHAVFKDALHLLNKLENELQLFLYELNVLKINLHTIY